jgi:hypothetical protein
LGRPDRTAAKIQTLVNLKLQNEDSIWFEIWIVHQIWDSWDLPPKFGALQMFQPLGTETKNVPFPFEDWDHRSTGKGPGYPAFGAVNRWFTRSLHWLLMIGPDRVLRVMFWFVDIVFTIQMICLLIKSQNLTATCSTISADLLVKPCS